MPRVLRQDSGILRLHVFSPEGFHTTDPEIAEYRSKLLSSDAIVDTELAALIGTGFGNESIELGPKIAGWDSFVKTSEHAAKNIPATLASCWYTHAGLHYHHGIEHSLDLEEKISGLYTQDVLKANHPFMRGVSDEPLMEVSRYRQSNEEQLREIVLSLAYNEATGTTIAWDPALRRLLVSGHIEYEGPAVLEDEWKRDLQNPRIAATTQMPVGIYIDDDPAKGLRPNDYKRDAQALIDHFLAVAAGDISLEDTPMMAAETHDRTLEPRVLAV